jgi:FkbM family methyltransferase
MIEGFLHVIPDKNKEYIIFDVGSRDCLQSIEFYNAFPHSKIYAFECNPNTLHICKKNIEAYSDRITLIEGAVCDYDGEITFYPINQQKTITSWKDGNPGASSLFKSNGSYIHEKYIQDEIKTNCHRLDTIMQKYNIPRVDIIWMDLQGAELLALKGLGSYLDNVKYIHTEASHREMYSGQVMFKELNDFVLSHNFVIKNNLTYTGWQEDIIYERTHDLSRFEKKIYSQNKEDGITLEIIKRLGIKEGYYVEFGTQNGDECNTRILREHYGWKGLLMDGSYCNESINLKKEFITRENIQSLFKKYSVPSEFNLLSIDIDFNDFYVLHKILEKYSIDIIILEYNAYFEPTEDAIIKYSPLEGWDGLTNYFSASLLSFQKLLNKYNYNLVYTETKGVNAFFVKNKHADKFTDVDNINLLYNSAKYGKGPRGGHYQCKKNRSYIKFNDVVDAFDVVIPVGPNDISVLEKQIEYTKKNIIGYRNIYLICFDPTIYIEGCITINENIFPFTLESVSTILGKAEDNGWRIERNGWYLQQLLKLYAGKVIPGILERYLVIDSDTFFLKPTIFIENNKCLYNYSNEYHTPYFRHMNLLYDGLEKVDRSKSGICHHMIFETKYINELINIIEEKHNNKFYNIFLKLVLETNNEVKNTNCASEYEIYFNYMLKYHSDKIIIRPLKWCNSSALNDTNNYDYISCHWYSRK